MARHTVSLPSPRSVPWLEIASHGRGGPASPTRFTPAQLALIARTVRRTPEVMVKVSGGGRSISAVEAHLKYIDRHGQLDLETDDGDRLHGKSVERQLVTAWDLDADSGRFLTAPRTAKPRRPPKQVHNIILSMPIKTDANKLLAACRVFARESFALKHRYAMVLHTDQAHPHVHLVVKDESEQGVRLNIRKATLREWREQFAGQLRAVGVAANASPRAVRGLANTRLPAGLYRVLQRRESKLARPVHASSANRQAGSQARPPSITQAAARQALAGWESVHKVLVRSGEQALARQVQAYAAEWTTQPGRGYRSPIEQQR